MTAFPDTMTLPDKILAIIADEGREIDAPDVGAFIAGLLSETPLNVRTALQSLRLDGRVSYAPDHVHLRPRESVEDAKASAESVEIATFQGNGRVRLAVDITVPNLTHDVLDAIAFIRRTTVSELVARAIEDAADGLIEQPSVLEVLKLREERRDDRLNGGAR